MRRPVRGGRLRQAHPARPAIRHFIAEVERHHPLTNRERLVLAYVCHGHDVLPSELASGLALADDELDEWIGRLEELGVPISVARCSRRSDGSRRGGRTR